MWGFITPLKYFNFPFCSDNWCNRLFTIVSWFSHYVSGNRISRWSHIWRLGRIWVCAGVWLSWQIERNWWDFYSWDSDLHTNVNDELNWKFLLVWYLALRCLQNIVVSHQWSGTTFLSLAPTLWAGWKWLPGIIFLSTVSLKRDTFGFSFTTHNVLMVVH